MKQQYQWTGLPKGIYGQQFKVYNVLPQNIQPQIQVSHNIKPYIQVQQTQPTAIVLPQTLYQSHQQPVKMNYQVIHKIPITYGGKFEPQNHLNDLAQNLKHFTMSDEIISAQKHYYETEASRPCYDIIVSLIQGVTDISQALQLMPTVHQYYPTQYNAEWQVVINTGLHAIVNKLVPADKIQDVITYLQEYSELLKIVSQEAYSRQPVLMILNHDLASVTQYIHTNEYSSTQLCPGFDMSLDQIASIVQMNFIIKQKQISKQVEKSISKLEAEADDSPFEDNITTANQSIVSPELPFKDDINKFNIIKLHECEVISVTSTKAKHNSIPLGGDNDRVTESEDTKSVDYDYTSKPIENPSMMSPSDEVSNSYTQNFNTIKLHTITTVTESPRTKKHNDLYKDVETKVNQQYKQHLDAEYHAQHLQQKIFNPMDTTKINKTIQDLKQNEINCIGKQHKHNLQIELNALPKNIDEIPTTESRYLGHPQNLNDQEKVELFQNLMQKKPPTNQSPEQLKQQLDQIQQTFIYSQVSNVIKTWQTHLGQENIDLSLTYNDKQDIMGNANETSDY